MEEGYEIMGRQVTGYQGLVDAAMLQESKARSINRLIKSVHFYELFEAASIENYDILMVIISDLNANGLKKWITSNRSNTLNDLTTAQLREVARKYTIKNYSNMTKVELIIAVIKKELSNDEN
jgi:hypothetical protein